MSTKIKGDQKGVAATTAGFKGVSTISKFADGNVLNKRALWTPD